MQEVGSRRWEVGGRSFLASSPTPGSKYIPCGVPSKHLAPVFFSCFSSRISGTCGGAGGAGGVGGATGTGNVAKPRHCGTDQRGTGAGWLVLQPRSWQRSPVPEPVLKATAVHPLVFEQAASQSRTVWPVPLQAEPSSAHWLSVQMSAVGPCHVSSTAAVALASSSASCGSSAAARHCCGDDR